MADAVDKPILLIDDSVDIREAFQILMELEGFKVITLDSARAGLDFLAKGEITPRIIILDLSMPDMDGHEFLRLRAEKKIALDVPVLVFSAHKQTEVLPGTVGWTKKPVDIDELIEQIKKYS